MTHIADSLMLVWSSMECLHVWSYLICLWFSLQLPCYVNRSYRHSKPSWFKRPNQRTLCEPVYVTSIPLIFTSGFFFFVNEFTMENFMIVANHSHKKFNARDNDWLSFYSCLGNSLDIFFHGVRSYFFPHLLCGGHFYCRTHTED